MLRRQVLEKGQEQGWARERRLGTTSAALISVGLPGRMAKGNTRHPRVYDAETYPQGDESDEIRALIRRHCICSWQTHHVDDFAISVKLRASASACTVTCSEESVQVLPDRYNVRRYKIHSKSGAHK